MMGPNPRESATGFHEPADDGPQRHMPDRDELQVTVKRMRPEFEEPGNARADAPPDPPGTPECEDRLVDTACEDIVIHCQTSDQHPARQQLRATRPKSQRTNQ